MRRFFDLDGISSRVENPFEMGHSQASTEAVRFFTGRIFKASFESQGLSSSKESKPVGKVLKFPLTHSRAWMQPTSFGSKFGISRRNSCLLYLCNWMMENCKKHLRNGWQSTQNVFSRVSTDTIQENAKSLKNMLRRFYGLLDHPTVCKRLGAYSTILRLSGSLLTSESTSARIVDPSLFEMFHHMIMSLRFV